MLCYRCGGHVRDGFDKCSSCGQAFSLSLQPGAGAGFGAGSRRHRVAIEGTPYRAGDAVARRYQVKDHIGAGPVGWVYRSADAGQDADVGLKIISPRFLQAPDEKKAFFAEMEKAKALAHANIVPVYDFGEEGERPWVAVQLLDGLTLRRIMEVRRQKGQGFTLKEVEPIVAQIAAALEAAADSFAHGDLKPDNVIVLPDLLKLTDFGLATSLPRAPFMAAQKACGMHRYVAPEFLLGDRLDPRTDVYSLGVMLGEMLGGVPFEPALDLAARNPALPRGLQDIFQRAVAPRAHQRYPAASDLADELSDLLERGEPPSPTSTTRPNALRPSLSQPPPLPASAMAPPVEPAIEEVHTDPRVRIARALAEQDEQIRAAATDARKAVASASSAAVQIPGTLQTHLDPEEPARPRRGRRHGKPERRNGRKAPREARDETWAPPAIAPAVVSAAVPVATLSFGAPVEPTRKLSAVQIVIICAVAAAAALAIAAIANGSANAAAESAAAAQPKNDEPTPAKARPPEKPGEPKPEPAKPAEPAKAAPVEQPPAKAPLEDRAALRRERQKLRKAANARLASLAEKMLARREARTAARQKPAADQSAAQAVAARAAATPAPAPAPAPVKVAAPAPAAPAAASRVVIPGAAAKDPGGIPGVDDPDLVAKKKADTVLASVAIPAVAKMPAPAVSAVACPDGMVAIPAGRAAIGADAKDDLRNFGDRNLITVDVAAFCIDRYEFPNQPGRIPRVGAAFGEAEQLCAQAGKRLCAEEEWEKACKGPGDLRFPYGAQFDAEACNTQDARDQIRQVGAAGAFARCKSGYGVFDLSGNVAEWTSSSFGSDGGEKAVKGGSASKPRFEDRCASRRKAKPSLHDVKIGFRCCAAPR